MVFNRIFRGVAYGLTVGAAALAIGCSSGEEKKGFNQCFHLLYYSITDL